MTTACRIVAILVWTLAMKGVVADSPAVTDQQIRDAFTKVCDGYSSDEVMIRDDLRRAFVDELSVAGKISRTSQQQRDLFLRLLRLRKAGKLNTRATKRAGPVDDSVRPVAEMAARSVMDRHRVTTDQMLADPSLLDQLHDEAEKLSPGVDPYAVRKTILKLRKTRRLRPELVLQVADWDRDVRTLSWKELVTEDLPESPGVYLFRDAEGYLYIGEAINLADRLRQHAEGSHNASLAAMLASQNADDVTLELHVFEKDSPAAKTAMRRAYESELIRSRHPKYNLRP